MTLTWILVIALVVVIFWVFSTYNFFVGSKARIKAAVQEIGNQLKRQSDLIPNLEVSTKGYLKHEQEIFSKLTEVRKSIESAIKSQDVQKMADAGSKVASLLPDIKLVMESNPEIKGSEVVVKLMDELRDTSDKIMYARRLVIDLTADYNVKRVSVPSSFIASMFKFAELPGLITPQEGEHVEVKTEETKTPKISL
ncbi:hypothetical protein A2W13_00685 [Candidatus Woesebacteria bacterium RBG_16_36_11]|uniref:LemA family protein n=2 Tax=Candidatus Woeseibacteriota TaxID=1752722 RepID=A0A1F7XAW6_9BACT|nr:MAG: hypothetical protein A2W13_00685 [Candidatus Woesebacteria bacterium RBG_16_36_11]OGM17091.1 MAG: hypothetical protein A2V55_02495 [Candidatus Woesebacteria bacterium RBG_19FT_COMBO_37_29]